MKNSEQKYPDNEQMVLPAARRTARMVLDGWMEGAEADWPRYRAFFWAFAVATITGMVVIATQPPARPSLLEQLVVFLGLAAFGSWLGFMVGYFNHSKKRPLAVANILWICIALWSVHATLSQVADHLDKSDRELEQLSLDIAFTNVARTIAKAENALCDQPRAYPAACESVRTVRIELSLPMHTKNLYGISKAMEKVVPALATQYPSLGQDWETYKASAALYAAGESARKPANYFIALQFSYLMALILTFCFVMTNAGAEWRRAKLPEARRGLEDGPPQA